jgi:hypothetical protein
VRVCLRLSERTYVRLCVCLCFLVREKEGGRAGNLPVGWYLVRVFCECVRVCECMGYLRVYVFVCVCMCVYVCMCVSIN